MAGAVDAEADLERDAALAVPGHLGPDAHGRRREHDHHPRRRQPARPALAVLGATTPLSYIGWGKTTQLGYGLGLAMGAKLAQPDKLCINVWGDAAIGFTGMDFETAVRERIPILSILLNNFSMAIELPIMQVATAKYRSTDISGNYADFARALGGYGERVTEPEQIVPAIKRGIEQTREGTPGPARIHHRKGGRRLQVWLRRTLVKPGGSSVPRSEPGILPALREGCLLCATLSGNRRRARLPVAAPASGALLRRPFGTS